MTQYKTVCIPNIPYKGVNKKEFYEGIKMDTANRAVSPIGQAIEGEARGGWKLHSINIINTTVIRKKSIFEILFGWIPILGGLICRNIEETVSGGSVPLYVLLFEREN